MTNVRNSPIPVDPGSGNVFVDLGLADARERTTKVALAVEINRILKAKGLTQTTAAKRLAVNQTKISTLADYRLEAFSVERLMSFLTSLGHDIQISIRSRRSARAHGRIMIGGG